MPYTTLFFDLDDTLYPASSGLWQEIRSRIEVYMHERLGFAAEEIPTVRRDLFTRYGTTYLGLKQEYRIDPMDFLAYVHDLPLNRFLAVDPGLRRMLEGLPQQKIIFTNADRNHASRVLTYRGITDCFTGVVDILRNDPYCKPRAEAYLNALAEAGNPSPEQCVMIDDAPRNLVTARELGMYTVYVGDQPCDCAHARIQSILELPEVLSPALSRTN